MQQWQFTNQMIKNITRTGLIFKEITLTPESEEPETAVSDPTGSTMSFRFRGFEFGGRGGRGLLSLAPADGDEYGSGGGAFSLGNLCFRLLLLEFGSGGVGHFCNCFAELGLGEVTEASWFSLEIAFLGCKMGFIVDERERERERVRVRLKNLTRQREKLAGKIERERWEK